MQIKNNVFIVTGGASGIGLGCVQHLIRAGAKIIIVDLNAAQGEKASQETGATFVQTNVTDEKSAQLAIDTAWKKFGNLHGVINCAGIAIAEKILNKEGNVHSLESFRKVLDINVAGTFNMIRLAAASMTKNISSTAVTERGVFITTASVAAFDGQIGQIAYSASKGAIAAMTLPLAREFARFGMRVVTIAPGIFDTPMLAGLSEAARESLGKQVPFPPRLGRPEEYAMLAAQIIENEMLNGEVIRLDGALRMAAK